MERILCALLVLRVATGYSIITKSMLYGTEEPSLEPVQLQTKLPETVTTERSVRIRQTPKELLRSLGYIGDEEHFEGRDMADHDSDSQELSAGDSIEDDDYYDDMTPTPHTTSLPERPKNVPIVRRADTVETTQNRTKLYPVGRLWERTMPQRPMPGLMAILDAAFSCMWSGLGFECFSLKVVPMFRAMMGFPPVNPFGHPYYVLPRTTDIEDSETDEDDEQDLIMENSKVLFKGERRRRRRRFWGLKLVKGAMIGLAAVKTLVLPALSLLSIMSGKAIIFSLVAVVLTIAAGWTTAKSADRRVLTAHTIDTDTPYRYYM